MPSLARSALRAQRADVGSGLRLGQLHGAHPFAADELAEICLLEHVAAVGMQRVDRRHSQHGADAERHRGRVPHLDAGRVHRMRQILPAPFGGRGEAVPARRRPGGVGLFPAGRGGDVAVLERRAELVADAVERRDHVAANRPASLQHRIDRFLVEIAVKPFRQCGFQAGGVFERKSDVGDRSAIGHSANVAAGRGWGKAPAGDGLAGAPEFEPGNGGIKIRLVPVIDQ